MNIFSTMCDKKLLAVALLLATFLFPARIRSMESANFKINSDSVNFGGKDDGASENYQLKETMGETGTGGSESENYMIDAGYRAMFETESAFTFSISASGCPLNILLPGSVSSCNYNITTTSNSEDGYSATIIEDGNLRDGANDINDVADGTVTAGSEEYGVALTGTDRAFADEEAITGTALTLASDATGPVSAQAVTVTHKASITSATLAGSYSHTVTLISTGTF